VYDLRRGGSFGTLRRENVVLQAPCRGRFRDLGREALGRLILLSWRKTCFISSNRFRGEEDVEVRSVRGV
jgi:hypothetical protein